MAVGCQQENRLPSEVDYNYHVKPILSDRCYKCHGPDNNTRKAELRLDTQEGIFQASREDSSQRIITPGDPQTSKLLYHITETDPKRVMPPPESNLSLSAQEIALIRRWIEQGAVWTPHWAFLAPQVPEEPTVERTSWPRNAIDKFVLHRMERTNLSPSPEASREKLLRRITFDLTGLPPTPEEIDAFLSDTHADAYKRVLDRLLDSPAYGERMTSGWLDIARYADTHGYQDDRPRTMWPWRDWVIKAFNSNLPYDQFVTWQLAGDLLPEAAYTQTLATGFNRNHAITQEGGVVAEEYLTEYVADRTNTTATAFLGLTMECARCHDHKFDPISQKDYYQLFAFFNTMQEDAQIDYFNLSPTPSIRMESPRLEEEIAQTLKGIEVEEDYLAARIDNIDETFHAWQIRQENAIDMDGTLKRDLLVYDPLETVQNGVTPHDARANTGLENVLATPQTVTDNERKAILFDGANFLNMEDAADVDWYDRFSFGAWIKTPAQRLGKDAALLSKRNGEQKRGGYELVLTSDGHLRVLLIHDAEHSVDMVTTSTIPLRQWTHVFFTYDGSGRSQGATIYVNGVAQHTRILQDDLDRHSILNGNDLLAGNWTPRMKNSDAIHGFVNGVMSDVRFYHRTLTSLEVKHLAGKSDMPEHELWPFYLNTVDPAYRKSLLLLDSLRRSYQTIPFVMVMQDAEHPRPTYVLARGAYNAPGDSVGPDTPNAIMPFPDDLPRNRLGLAQWIVHPENPLTARVAVNRLWQMIFGTALVRTPEDFGNQGALPTHPQLLDFLAVTFIKSGWDVKALLRLLVTSATYRQEATVTPATLAHDPDNTWLARGPKKRLSAEMMRDHALMTSGLLTQKVGGPPVRPYQPTGLWKALANQIGENKYRPGRGNALYRRSLYTYWKRTIPPPAMLTFDAAERTLCTVKRHVTSTPLQSLVLLNDPQYVEAARVMAERLLTMGELNTAARITYAFRLVTSRTPTPEERVILLELHAEQQDRFIQYPERARDLIQVGEHPSIAELDKVELATLTVVTNSLFNLYETQFY